MLECVFIDGCSTWLHQVQNLLWATPYTWKAMGRRGRLLGSFTKPKLLAIGHDMGLTGLTMGLQHSEMVDLIRQHMIRQGIDHYEYVHDFMAKGKGKGKGKDMDKGKGKGLTVHDNTGQLVNGFLERIERLQTEAETMSHSLRWLHLDLCNFLRYDPDVHGDGSQSEEEDQPQPAKGKGKIILPEKGKGKGEEGHQPEGAAAAAEEEHEEK
jgi:hypothetical protein